MQVVILAAGRGQRFAEAGYTDPKPLIKARGREMLEYAWEAAESVGNPLVLCTQQVYDHTGIDNAVVVRHTQSGAAMTMLAAATALDETQPVLTMDCDSIIDKVVLRDFVAMARRAFDDYGYHSAVLCFQPSDDSSRYSFVQAAQAPLYGALPQVVQVVEKTRISNIATTGVHAFRSWAVLRQAICDMVSKRASVNGEYYLAPAHNFVDRTTYMITTGFTSIGTPEELQAYEQQAISASK